MAVVLQMDTQNAIAGIFSQIVTEDEGGREMNIREKGIEYISTSLMSMRHKLFLNNPENEKFLLEQIKKVRRERRYSCRKCCITWSMCLSVSHLHILQVLVDVTGEEFETLMDVLSKLKYTSTPDGAKDVVAIISEQAELASEFQVKTFHPTSFLRSTTLLLLRRHLFSLSPLPQPQDVESIDRFTTCFRQALKFCKVCPCHTSINLLICTHTTILGSSIIICFLLSPQCISTPARPHCFPVC